ncbi:MAG: response regulator [Phycisphaerales bacterium]|nr:response regulator [Phycisphaerales bacterium]MCI0675217.1 response regulator [Phycisphaerales bacterium]
MIGDRVASNLSGLEGLRILLVEDMAVVAEAIAGMLRDFGCKVVGPVSTLDEAAHAVREKEFDGVLLDLNLHGEMAFGVADGLISRGVPFIFLTGYGRTAFERPYDEQAMIEKPFTQEELKAIMVRVFGGVGVSG